MRKHSNCSHLRTTVERLTYEVCILVSSNYSVYLYIIKYMELSQIIYKVPVTIDSMPSDDGTYK